MPETAVKIFRIFIAAEIADFTYAHCRIFQQLLRFLQTYLFQQFGKGAARDFSDVSGAVNSGISQLIGEAGQGNVGGIIENHADDPGNGFILSFYRLRICSSILISPYKLVKKDNQHTADDAF